MGPYPLAIPCTERGRSSECSYKTGNRAPTYRAAKSKQNEADKAKCKLHGSSLIIALGVQLTATHAGLVM